MPQNTVLRFHSFAKNAGQGDSWADIYRQRTDKLKKIFPSMSIIAIPTDQIISEDQVAKRIGEYIRGYDRQKLPQIMTIIVNIIKAIRLGNELTADEMKMATYSGFEGFYSFGPAANFYVNKLGFSVVPAGVAMHKQIISKEEQELLDKLKEGGYLKEDKIIKLFSGRGLVKRVSSSSINTFDSSAVEATLPSSSIVDTKGGIAFNALPIQTQAMPSTSSPLSLTTNFQPLTSMELDAEWAQIQAVFNAGIRPSVQRISEYTAAAASSAIAGEKIDQVRAMLADILRRDEESEKLKPAEEVFKKLLSALESDKPASELYLSLT